MENKIFKSIEEMGKYYNKETNTFTFLGDVILKFNLKCKWNIIAYNIYANDIEANDIDALCVYANDIKAANVDVDNINANNIVAKYITTLIINASNVEVLEKLKN